MKAFSSLAAMIVVGVSIARAGSFAGRWDASITIKDAVIPFRLDISGEGANLTGTLYNGDQTQTTTSARVEDGAIVLSFDHYLTKIVATPKDGQLEGKVQGRFGGGERYIGDYPFHAKRFTPSTAAVSDVPSIEGLWEIPHDTPKGEKAWRFIVKQYGPEVSAAILRVDGDTGALTGSYRDGKFVLSHFDGSRPALMEITAVKDGTLEIQQSGSNRDGKLIAYRPEEARAKGLPEPADFTAHTTMKDPNEPLTFRFPDINGKLVSNEDPKFKGKVVIAIVTGTWCPNCHDEAQYLVSLYAKYRSQGLEVVALDFEEPEQQDDLARVRSFMKKYGVEYTYLIAGAPVEMWEKVPQAVNLNTWPATFFVGRDGRVKKIHAGFAAPASGDYNRQIKEEFTSTIEHLLAESGAESIGAQQ